MSSNLTINLDLSNAVAPPPEPVASPKRELLKHIDGDDYLLVLDNTALETFTTCPYSAMYKLVYSRQAHDKNAALTFGGAVHNGLETVLRGPAKDKRCHPFYLPKDAPHPGHEGIPVPESDSEFTSRINASIVETFVTSPRPTR